MELSDDHSTIRVEAEPGIGFGVGARLDAWLDGEWIPTYWLNTSPGSQPWFIPIGEPAREIALMLGGTRDLNLALPPLDPGWYRVCKALIDQRDGFAKLQEEAEVIFEVPALDAD